MFRLVPLSTVLVVLWVSSWVMAAERVAVIPAGGGDAPKLAPLIEAVLQHRGLQLVERQALGKLLAEQELDAAMGAPGTADRVKLGRLLKADYLVFVRCPDQPVPHLEVTACETTQGIRLVNRMLPRGQDGERDAAAVDAIAAEAMTKAKKPGLTIVAVAPWDSGDFTQRFDYRRSALRRVAEQALIGRDDVVLVEFKEAQALATVLAVEGQSALNRKQPLMLAGRVTHSSMKPDADVTVNLELTRGATKLGSWNSGEVSPTHAADVVPSATIDLFNKAGSKNIAAAPKVQAAELAERGRLLLKLSFYSDACELFEAALLLNPQDVSLHSEIFRAIGTQIAKQGDAALAEAGADAGRDEVLAKFAGTVDTEMSRRGLSHFEYYLTHTKLSLKQDFTDFTDDQWIVWLAPPRELRDMNYRVLKYKHDNNIKDQYAWAFNNQMDAENHFDRFPKPTPDENADDAARMADVWITGNRDWDILTMVNALHLRDALTGISPQQTRLLAAMEQSANPDARAGAVKLRQDYASQITTNRPAPASQPSVVRQNPQPPAATAPLARIHLPTAVDCETYAFTAAGPGADLFYARAMWGTTLTNEPRCLYYFRSDGWGRELPHMAAGSAPAFDGRYAWFVGSENGTAVVYAYDPSADKLWIAKVEQGVPPDVVSQAWITPLAQGSACIAACIGDPAERTWIAIVHMDAAGPDCKVVLQCRERSGNQRGDGPIGCAFVPSFMFVLPGPPGAKEKATPHVYVGRGMKKSLLIDPETRACSLADVKAIDGRDIVRPEAPAAAAWEKKLYFNFKTWDPASNTVATLPKPADLSRRNATPSIAFFNGSCYVFDGVQLYAGPPEKPLHSIMKLSSPSSLPDLTTSRLFGVVVQGDVVAPVLPAPESQWSPVPDFEAWLRAHAALSPDVGAYRVLAGMYRKRGRSEAWIAAMDGWLKYRPHDLEYAQSEVEVADYLMSKGDYDRARKYADDAAKSGAEWASQCAGYVAEGLGDWGGAEAIAKETGEGYGHPGAWFGWCCRTGHGDIAAARARATATINGASDDRDALVDAASFYLETGDTAKAQIVLRRMTDKKQDVWASLQAAVIAVAENRPADRDSALAAAVGDTPLLGTQLHTFANLVAEAFKTGKPLDVQKIEQMIPVLEDPAEAANINYFTGRFLLAEGDKDAGIKYLKRAAGLNSHKSARVLAAQELRSLGQEVPKPGQTQ